jgi:hypothetical protein
MEDTVRWTVKVSRETDTALRSYLAQRGMKKGDISKFVEEAVRWRVLDRVVSEVKARNTGVPARKIQAAIDEVLAEVRAEGLAAAAR